MTLSTEPRGQNTICPDFKSDLVYFHAAVNCGLPPTLLVLRIARPGSFQSGLFIFQRSAPLYMHLPNRRIRGGKLA